MNYRWKARLVERSVGRSSGVLLDFGCGTGDFLRAMVRQGWTGIGVETSQAARRIARSVSPSVDIRSSLDELAPGSSFDAITLWHALEHVYDPRSTLIALASTLNPGGAIIAAVPNHRSCDAQAYGPDWAAWDPPRHLSHFAQSDLVSLVESVGLKIQTARGMSQDAVYVAILSERIRGRGIGRGLWRGARLALRGWLDRQKASTICVVAKVQVIADALPSGRCV